MDALVRQLDTIAADTDFAGVVRVDRDADIAVERAYGFAHRAHEVPNTIDTQFGIASGTKGLTALTVVSLIADGVFDLATTARSVLGDDLPLIGDGVTIEQLLAHRSGIGDYLDEDAGTEVTDYLLLAPAQDLATTEQYVAVLGGHPAKFAPDARFAYCNGGYVVLALIAERASGVPFAELVRQRVCEPAGMASTAFLRADCLPGRAALGYLSTDPASPTNVFHLPVRGSGDGGIYSNAADISALWRAFLAGRIVPPGWVAEMARPRSDAPGDSRRYGLGFWLHVSTSVVILVGCDAGVSFHSAHDPDRNLTYTVLSNTTDGAWPVAHFLEETLAVSYSGTGR